MRRNFCYLLLLILPFMMVFTTLYLNKAKGPYWVGMNCDPDYTYMLNALNLARMKKVGHVDHPGTTVQVAGAIVLRTVHFFNFLSKEDLQTDVLKNPEFYLAVINKVFLGLSALILIILGIGTLHVTKNLPLSIIVQLSPLVVIGSVLPSSSRSVNCGSSSSFSLRSRISYLTGLVFL